MNNKGRNVSKNWGFTPGGGKWHENKMQNHTPSHLKKIANITIYANERAGPLWPGRALACIIKWSIADNTGGMSGCPNLFGGLQIYIKMSILRMVWGGCPFLIKNPGCEEIVEQEINSSYWTFLIFFLKQSPFVLLNVVYY